MQTSNCIKIQIMHYGKSPLEVIKVLCKEQHEIKYLVFNNLPCYHNLHEKFFTETSVHFIWKRQWIVHIGMFLEFCKNADRGMFFHWAWLYVISTVGVHWDKVKVSAWVCMQEKIISLRLCVCAQTIVFVTNEDTCVFIMTWVWHSYYKEKVTYEDIAPCTHFSKRL